VYRSDQGKYFLKINQNYLAHICPEYSFRVKFLRKNNIFTIKLFYKIRQTMNFFFFFKLQNIDRNETTVMSVLLEGPLKICIAIEIDT